MKEIFVLLEKVETFSRSGGIYYFYKKYSKYRRSAKLATKEMSGVFFAFSKKQLTGQQSKAFGTNFTIPALYQLGCRALATHTLLHFAREQKTWFSAAKAIHAAWK
jgi:hypothetical protein